LIGNVFDLCLSEYSLYKVEDKYFYNDEIKKNVGTFFANDFEFLKKHNIYCDIELSSDVGTAVIKKIKIAIVIICLGDSFNSGIRFVQNFIKYYVGNSIIDFYINTDTDPLLYFSNNEHIHHINLQSCDVYDNSIFKSVLSLKDREFDYLYYSDINNDINIQFDESWFLGEIVGVELFNYSDAGASILKDNTCEKYKTDSPFSNSLSNINYQAGFFGGKKTNVLELCNTINCWQQFDRENKAIPTSTEETYINRIFHFSPPYTIKYKNFRFNNKDTNYCNICKMKACMQGVKCKGVEMNEDSLKCISVGCSYKKHTDKNNNGGTNCCFSCKKTPDKHGSCCQKILFNNII